MSTRGSSGGAPSAGGINWHGYTAPSNWADVTPTGQWHEAQQRAQVIGPAGAGHCRVEED